MASARAFDPTILKAGAAEYSSSDSDDEDDDDFQKPSIDPRADEFADFNPRKRRRTGRDAKESAALGIFGSDSEDDGALGGRSRRKNLRSKGMSFVSSTDHAAKGSEDEDMADEDDEEDTRPTLRAREEDDDGEEEEEGDDEDDNGAPGIGLGFKSTTASGNGWASAGLPSDTLQGYDPLKTFSKGGARSAATSFVKPKNGNGSLFGNGFVPSSDNQPVLDPTISDTPTRPQVARPSAFSTKGGKTKINASSFGARMMAKMGYKEGQGLGAEGQGRDVIIETSLRPQRVGLGAVKEKTQQERDLEKRQARARGEVVVDSDEEEKKKKAAARKKKAAGLPGALRSGTGSAASTPRRQKPKYLTMDEVKKAAPGLNIPDAFTPILDMTGSGKKMLTSSSGLMTPTGGTAAEDEDDVQSKKMVRRAQNDFMAILEEWQGLQERKAYAELQLRQEQQELEELEKVVSSHNSLAAIFDELLQLEQLPNEDVVMNGGDHTKHQWDRVIALLRKANESASSLTVQAVREEMASTAVAALHPILADMIENWNPLQSPRAEYASDLESIKELLGLDKSAAVAQARASATPYESMMYKLWLPHVSRSIREWNVRDADPMIAVYEAWCPVLPGFIQTCLLEQDLVRKLDEAIAKWEPKRKKQHNLPHLWLFPWLQHLPHHHLDPKSTTGLVADVKRKFRQLVDVWEFDRGVIPGLKEWKNVLRPSKANDQWKPLVMNHILPSMARYLRKNFSVQPSDQEPYLPALTGVLEWRHVVSPTMVAEVVVAEVFPKWHAILYQWLVDEDVSYEDIAHWCEWWHDADGPLPVEIRDSISVASEFEKGLHTIERALDLFELGEDPKATLAPPASGAAFVPQHQQTTNGGHHHHHHRHHNEHKQQQQHSAPAPTKDAAEARSLRHVVEDWCQENDLQFIPERKQHHSEGPLYRITARGDGKGGKLVYFKGAKMLLLAKNGGVEEFGESEADLERLMTHVM